MPSFSELIAHRTVQIALGIVVLMGVASAAYYAIESRPPAYTFATAAIGAVTDDVTANGTVSSVENPNISFTDGGRVTYVGVKVGDTVAQGQLLASLDTGILAANLASAQARLSGLVDGPRAVDVAGKQTAVAQSKQFLANMYASVPSDLATAASGIEDAVRVNTDSLFTGMNSATHPHASFSTRDDAAAEQAGIDRGQLSDDFDKWNAELADLPANPTADEAAAALASARTHAALAQRFFTDLSEAASAGDPALDAGTLGAIAAGRSAVNAAVSSLTSGAQTIANQTLAVQSAEDALALANAPAAPSDLQAAQAAVDAASAALRQSQATAPFSGTVASVSVKTGDVIEANAAAVSLVPAGNFQVEAYLSEIDATRIHAGDAADITLDAYGAGTVFPATVASVDAAPSTPGGAPSYKATLVFANADARIASGMHANVTVRLSAKDGVLTIPTAAVGTDSAGTFVLKEEGSGTVRTPIVLGMQGSESVEVASGLSAGDRVALFAGTN